MDKTAKVLIIRKLNEDGKMVECNRWFEVHDVQDDGLAGFWCDGGDSDVLDYEAIELATESKYRLQKFIR